MHTLSRRHVIATLTASAAVLCPAVLNAQSSAELGWGPDAPTDAPIGQSATFEVPEGPATIDVSALAPGEVAVISRPSTDDIWSRTNQIQYVGVLHRTDAQLESASDDARYMVVNLVCPHRGFAVGVSNDPATPFVCTKRGDRHASNFDIDGFGVSGGSKGDALWVPDHSMDAESGVLTLA